MLCGWQELNAVYIAFDALGKYSLQNRKKKQDFR
jgi:hypothetical protein